jgi:hypothetical protein
MIELGTRTLFLLVAETLDSKIGLFHMVLLTFLLHGFMVVIAIFGGKGGK